MNTEWQIARRLIARPARDMRRIQPIIRLTTASVALGVMVMIIAMSVLVGFKKQIAQKVTDIFAHIQIVNNDGYSAYETAPIVRSPSFLEQIRGMPQVAHVQPYAIKAGIASTENDVQGIVLKGIDHDFDWSFFDGCMVEGAHFTLNDSATSNGVCISKTLAALLHLNVSDRFDVYFAQQPPRVRRFKINGIFDTQFGELDKLYVLCDMRHVQRLNNWSSEQVSGLEIFLSDFSMLEPAFERIREQTFFTAEHENAHFMVENIKQRHAQIFDWLGVLDLNALIIFVLMLLVAAFNMITGLLILTIERAPLIGLFKALGAANLCLRRIFIYQAIFIALRGLLFGSAAGIALCLLQRHFGVIALNPDTYYLPIVPIEINWLYILLLNAASFAVIVLMLMAPSMIIGRINPSTILRFL
jgi:lipoprotein-releasing system permease protein